MLVDFHDVGDIRKLSRNNSESLEFSEKSKISVFLNHLKDCNHFILVLN